MLEAYMNEYKNVKDQLDKLTKQTKDLNVQKKMLEQSIIAAMRAEGLGRASTMDGSATATIKHEVYPGIEDWDSFIVYIKTSDQFALLKKSINSAVWRELYDAGELIPGISTYEEDTLLFRRKIV